MSASRNSLAGLRLVEANGDAAPKLDSRQALTKLVEAERKALGATWHPNRSARPTVGGATLSAGTRRAGEDSRRRATPRSAARRRRNTCGHACSRRSCRGIPTRMECVFRSIDSRVRRVSSQCSLRLSPGLDPPVRRGAGGIVLSVRVGVRRYGRSSDAFDGEAVAHDTAATSSWATDPGAPPRQIEVIGLGPDGICVTLGRDPPAGPCG